MSSLCENSGYEKSIIEELIPKKEAWGLLDQLGLESVAQHNSVPVGSCSRTLVAIGVQSKSNAEVVLHLKGKASTFRADPKIDGRDRNEVVVEVGSLDSGSGGLS
ncbi:hypothetical protein PVK06_043865 [Gossypium arboreum]|uniref:Uncharacterized protein n=1 Tax=Gossypium arboreum TaxID=29729 RepID=A0ABR0MS58_GOSAR|nr:hypothetical protein PVK06_043865 [Gossypium arboreum]